jgi:hypothetical protein
MNGNDIDAVAASLIDGPQQEEDETTEEVEAQAEADADAETDADEAEADEAEASEDESEDDSEDADEGEAEQQLFTVKVDGREVQVTQDELIRGYSGQAYIQKGMQENAQARKEVEAVYAALQSERQQIAQFAQAMQTGQLPMQPPQAPSEDLLQKDPIGYLEARVKYDKELAAYQQTQMQVQQMSAQQAAVEEQARMAYLADQHRQLAQVIPAFAKPEVAVKVKADLIAAGSDYGFSQDELRAIADHRQLRVLHDAAQYRRLMSGKAVAEKQASQPKTPVIKPGAKVGVQAGKRVQTEKAKAQMKRSGSVDDVARFLLM